RLDRTDVVHPEAAAAPVEHRADRGRGGQSEAVDVARPEHHVGPLGDADAEAPEGVDDEARARCPGPPEDPVDRRRPDGAADAARELHELLLELLQGRILVGRAGEVIAPRRRREDFADCAARWRTTLFDRASTGNVAPPSFPFESDRDA